MKELIEKLKTVQGLLVAFAAVFVVIPSVVNTALDAYRTIRNIPQGIQQQANHELFQRHFQEQPASSLPMVVKTDTGTLDVNIDIYRNGDIFVAYGDHTQWFPFETAKTAAGRFRIIATAEAAELKGEGAYQQRQENHDGSVVRERIYQNSVKETLVIDRNSGRILQRTTASVPDEPPRSGWSKSATPPTPLPQPAPGALPPDAKPFVASPIIIDVQNKANR